MNIALTPPLYFFLTSQFKWRPRHVNCISCARSLCRNDIGREKLFLQYRLSKHVLLSTFQDVEYVIYRKNGVLHILQGCVFWNSFFSVDFTTRWTNCFSSKLWKVTDLRLIETLYGLIVLIVIWNSSKKHSIHVNNYLIFDIFRYVLHFSVLSGCCDGYFFNTKKANCTSEHFLTWIVKEQHFKYLKCTKNIYIWDILPIVLHRLIGMIYVS